MFLNMNPFREYLSSFDARDSKIALKVKHTMRVLQLSRHLAKVLNVDADTKLLVEYTALYHDLGRFEQVARYHTFLDAKSLDHAALSVKLLQENPQFLAGIDPQDAIRIMDAIAAHSLLKLPEMEDEKTLLLAKILRDADKLDIFRVFATEDLADSCGAGKKELEAMSFAPAVKYSILRHESVNKQDRESELDIFATFLGFFFDLNFDDTLLIALQEGYFEKPFETMHFQNPQAEADASEMLESVKAWIRTRLAAHAKAGLRP